MPGQRHPHEPEGQTRPMERPCSGYTLSSSRALFSVSDSHPSRSAPSCASTSHPHTELLQRPIASPMRYSALLHAVLLQSDQAQLTAAPNLPISICQRYRASSVYGHGLKRPSSNSVQGLPARSLAFGVFPHTPNCPGPSAISQQPTHFAATAHHLRPPEPARRWPLPPRRPMLPEAPSRSTGIPQQAISARDQASLAAAVRREYRVAGLLRSCAAALSHALNMNSTRPTPPHGKHTRDQRSSS